MDLLFIILVFIAGFIAGEMVLAYKLKNLLEDYIEFEREEEEETNQIFKLKTEKINDVLFLYDNTDNFVCQGATLEELAKLAIQYKNIKYAAVFHNEKMYMFVDGTVKQTA
jgi:hypothetical protein